MTIGGIVTEMITDDVVTGTTSGAMIEMTIGGIVTATITGGIVTGTVQE